MGTKIGRTLDKRTGKYSFFQKEITIEGKDYIDEKQYIEIYDYSYESLTEARKSGLPYKVQKHPISGIAMRYYCVDDCEAWHRGEL